MVSTVDGSRSISLEARIGAVTLARGTIARMRAEPAALGALWLVAGGAITGVTLAAEGAGIEMGTGAPTPATFAYNALLAFLSGALSAIGLRICLEGRSRWLAIDRGFLECAGLFAAMTFAFGLWMEAVGVTVASEPVPFLGIGLGVLAIAMFYAMVKLVLWPTGRLHPRARMTPRRSWRLMRKATRGYILAHLLLAIPFVVGTFAVAPTLDLETDRFPPLVTAAIEFAYVGYMIASLALTATLYALRASGPEAVAEVFD